MYEIFFESSFKILGYGLFVAVPLYVMAFHFQQRRLWVACGIVTTLIIAALIVEWAVVTPKEEVEKRVVQLAKVVEENQVDELLTYISQSKPGVLSRARQEMPNYEFDVCNLMIFHEIKVDENNPRKATADFMVRFNVAMKGFQGGGLRDVFLQFEKETDDQWRIVDYSHYDPANRPGKKNLFY